MKRGIDVSNHNGVIDWSKVKHNIDFVMIRAGYGQNNIDAKAVDNANGCIFNNIPFGFYWFSYALSESMAEKEAEYMCNFAKLFSPKLPLEFDWEYDSDLYSKSHGLTVSSEERRKIAKSFIDKVSSMGFTPMLYTNKDYLEKGFNYFRNYCPIWFAQWSKETPTIKCDIWQFSSSGNIEGINGYVDMNYSFMENEKESKEEKIVEKFKEKYKKVAEEIIAGKYKTGNERKRMLKENGYDAELAQLYVNELLK